MGANLKILPAYNPSADFSSDVFNLHRCSVFFDLIKKIEKYHGFIHMGYNPPVDEENKDLKCIYVRDLKEGLKGFKPLDYKNRTFMFFIENAPLNLKIWLLWE